jgi:hypothetical protein
MKTLLMISLCLVLAACNAEWIDCGTKDNPHIRANGSESAKHIKDCKP